MSAEASEIKPFHPIIRTLDRVTGGRVARFLYNFGPRFSPKEKLFQATKSPLFRLGAPVAGIVLAMPATAALAQGVGFEQETPTEAGTDEQMPATDIVPYNPPIRNVCPDLSVPKYATFIRINYEPQDVEHPEGLDNLSVKGPQIFRQHMLQAVGIISHFSKYSEALKYLGSIELTEQRPNPNVIGPLPPVTLILDRDGLPLSFAGYEPQFFGTNDRGEPIRLQYVTRDLLLDAARAESRAADPRFCGGTMPENEVIYNETERLQRVLGFTREAGFNQVVIDDTIRRYEIARQTELANVSGVR